MANRPATSLRRTLAGAALLGLLLATTPAVRADWIQLENGVQIHGKILRQNEEEITLELSRGGVSSFDIRIVVHVNRVEPENRTRLEVGPDKKDEEEYPDGLHPRPDATRSTRRPVPGGSLLVPEDAVEGTLIEPASAPPSDDPRRGTDRPDGASETSGPVRGAARRWLSVLSLDRGRSAVRIGREKADTDDDTQTDKIRTFLAGSRPGKVHSFERNKIAGITTWVAERTKGEGNGRVRIVTGWIRIDASSVQVIEVELPESRFLENPYRYRVIPRSFRPGTPEEAEEAPANPRAGDR